MLSIFESIKKYLVKNNLHPKIIFPEGDSKIVQEAATRLIKETNVLPVLLFKEKSSVPLNLLDKIEIVIINETQKVNYVDKLFELRKGKMTKVEATTNLSNTNYFAMMMLYTNEVQGLVGGVNFATIDIIKPALQIIKTSDGLACSVFIMSKNNKYYLFGDCGLIPEPSAEQLAQISEKYAFFGKQFELFSKPKVALLSYSTGFSGKGDSVDKVKKGYETLKQNNKIKIFYGPIQFDAAFDKQVQIKKIKNCPLEGQANVFVFPDLNSGNIGYKIAQRMGGYEAIGPIILGLNKPVMDLSRGANADDIFHTSLLVAKMMRENE